MELDEEGPDFFETASVADSDSLSTHSDSQNIDASHIQPKTARATFKHISAFNTDFSDSLKDKGSSTLSSFRQRLANLHAELADLADDINTNNLQQQPDSNNDSNSPSIDLQSYSKLIAQVSLLQGEISNIGNAIGSPATVDNLAPNISNRESSLLKYQELSKSLFSQLKAYKDSPPDSIPEQSSQQTSSTNPPHPSSSVTYELFYTPKTAQQISLSKIHSLDARLNKLETLIGTHYLKSNDSSHDPILELVNRSGSLTGAIERLENHLAILTDNRTLELLAKKLKGVLPDLERVFELKKKGGSLPLVMESSHKQQSEGQDSSSQRIDFLYQQLEKLDQVGLIVPNLLARMHALRGLHTEAMVFSDSLERLSEEQQRMSEVGAGMRDGLKRVETGMKENEERCTKNLESLDARVEALMKRIEGLK